jgi:acetyl esterase
MAIDSPMRERKPVDRALRRFLDEQARQAAAAGSTPPATDEACAQFRRMFILKALEDRTSIPGLPNGVETCDLTISQGLRARLYTPRRRSADPRLLPVVVYLHGGGWVAGSIATHDPFCRLLSEASGVIVASIEYRLAPEHRYPAALEDARTAVQWASEHATEWGGDPARLALGGDSAGANLAAVTAVRLAEGERLRALLLLYPVTDHPSANHGSYTENGTGYGIEANLMRWYWEQYAPGISPDDPSASPLRLPNLPPLPPTLVTTAEYDPLRDEGIAYAERLQAAGVAVTHTHSPDMTHNFPISPGTVARFPQCDTALEEIAGWLRATLAGNTKMNIGEAE